MKDNHPTLAEGIKEWFAAAQAGKLEHSYWEHSEYDKGHAAWDCNMRNSILGLT